MIGKKPGGEYIKSKHLCMVNGAKTPDFNCSIQSYTQRIYEEYSI